MDDDVDPEFLEDDFEDIHFGVDSSEEARSLVTAQPLMIAGGASKFDEEFDSYLERQRGRHAFCMGFSRLHFLAATVVVALALGGFSYSLVSRSAGDSRRNHSDDIITFQCPANVSVADNYDSSFETGYADVSKEIAKNVTAFMEKFRSEKFDEWDRTYEQVKEGSRHFKEKYYPPYLKSGDMIYESACGIGLNLYMTLEILHESANISRLVVYGNEYVDASAAQANAILDLAPPFEARKGSICTGDSTNLAFVPSNTFDLVFTGYISPLLDPLGFDVGLDENFDMYYTPLCEEANEDWKSQKLADIAQQMQEDWYGKWVKEMIRIAKPGKPVIVEQVSTPYCNNFLDWGGVAKDFWSKAIDRYGWDIDPETIQFEDDVIFRRRYHVFMLKTNDS